MNLIEALEIINEPIAQDAARFRIFLACGFTPLHLGTFLRAELRNAMPKTAVEVETGRFGDLAGNLERLSCESLDAVVALIEWSDLDPRLGIRRLGGWRYTDTHEIVDSARQQTARLENALRKLAGQVPVVINFPTLPLPPMFSSRTTESGVHELELRAMTSSLAVSLAREGRSRVISDQALAQQSPMSSRFDAGSELGRGFPYSILHSSVLATHVCTALRDVAPKKGLITDLDDTLWSGILGEIGPEEIGWMHGNAALHGIYQQFLESLASAGVLVGVATKNDLPVVEQAFAREDLLLSKQSVFPIEASWSAKSESVRRILAAWNVTADSVVVVDDSPLELAEIKQAFPDIECILFPKSNARETWDLLRRLRDVFGKRNVSEDDQLRLESLRNAGLVSSAPTGSIAAEDFLEKAQGTLSMTCGSSPDQRALELVNKTNQFNLNGRRFNDSAWTRYLRESNAFLITASYRDKFGPLGTISAVMGRTNGSKLYVDSWVLSCRAFSRRIEHQCLRYLFDRFGVEEIVFDYRETGRNHLVHEFFVEMGGVSDISGLLISKSAFQQYAPRPIHKLDERRDR